MKQIILPVTVHLNIRLPLALLQPEPADAPTGPEPDCLLYTSPSPRDGLLSRMPSSA